MKVIRQCWTDLQRLARERIDEQDRAFIKRYYVVNDTYGINEEPKYQYYEDLNEALSGLP